MLSSGCGRGREGQNQHGVCWDQTGQSQTQDRPHADGGALCFRRVLPANQRAQRHEKVKTSQARLIQGSKASQIKMIDGIYIFYLFVMLEAHRGSSMFNNDCI